MTTVKKIIHKIAENSLEAIKDSAKQIVDTVSPEALIKSATGQQTNEFTEYLKGVGNGLEGEALKNRQNEVQSEDERKKAELRQFLIDGLPAHMRLPQKAPEPRAYEKMLQEEQEKKQMQAQKNQQSSFNVPTSKATRGQMGGKKRPKAADFEASKNVKSG